MVVCGSDPVRVYLFRGGSFLVGHISIYTPGARPRDIVESIAAYKGPADHRFFDELNSTLTEAQLATLWQQIEVGILQLPC